MNRLKDRSIGFLISYMTRQAYRYFEIEFGKHNLNRGSIFILKRLYKSDGIKQNELSNSLYFDKANITRIIRKLIERDFVRKVPDKKDNRANRIFLTKKARDFENEFNAIFHGWGKIISEELSKEDEEQVWQYLYKMSENTQNYFSANTQQYFKDLKKNEE